MVKPLENAGNKAIDAAEASFAMGQDGIAGAAAGVGGKALGFLGKIAEAIGDFIQKTAGDSPLGQALAGSIGGIGQSMQTGGESMDNIAQEKFQNVSATVSDLKASVSSSSPATNTPSLKVEATSQQVALEKTTTDMSAPTAPAVETPSQPNLAGLTAGINLDGVTLSGDYNGVGNLGDMSQAVNKSHDLIAQQQQTSGMGGIGA